MTRALSVRLPMALAVGVVLPALSALAAGSCGGPARAARSPSAAGIDAASSLVLFDARADGDAGALDETGLLDAGDMAQNAIPVPQPTLTSLPSLPAPCFRSQRCLGVGWTVPPKRLCVRGESDGAGRERIDATTVRFEVAPEASSGTAIKALQLRCEARLVDDGKVVVESSFCIGTKSEPTSHTGLHFVRGVAICRPSALPAGDYTVWLGGMLQPFRIPDVVPSGGRCTEYHGTIPWGECPEDRSEDDVRRRMRP